jgi:hypothetical protein
LCAIFARLKRARTNAIDFARVNMAALAVPPSLLARWVLGGRPEGREYVAHNPRRADRTAGSFRISMTTGRWTDFATGDTGGDPVSLAAYLFDLSQLDAARRLAAMLGTHENNPDEAFAPLNVTSATSRAPDDDGAGRCRCRLNSWLIRPCEIRAFCPAGL